MALTLLSRSLEGDSAVTANSVAITGVGIPSSRPLGFSLRTFLGSTGQYVPKPTVDLPWSKAGGLDPCRRVQSFPRLCRFLSVHLLQD